jgi:hypothetical protein
VTGWTRTEVSHEDPLVDRRGDVADEEPPVAAHRARRMVGPARPSRLKGVRFRRWRVIQYCI